ncbi:D-2-hydroxyacid dehydrogenase [Clostridium disporicum]|jgi:D-3-phosphoglycerate dehydrogenase|uniref:D-3-phosphoglycerate dehydrogenase SerA n=1 Tax=Clostridium disporicum TaxID=84024 RepID=A0A174HUN7_9CLOT|nr:D-2-hydroxyacid dehydrogenase [Clostridium disporicum]CUO78604.1 D-3-phosphoglycerate dehydrogenase SerA [Clostridium disporicum]
MIKVLTNDGLQQEAIDNLKLLGIEVTNYHYSKEELKNILKDFDVITIRSATKIDSDILDSLTNKSNLKLIIRAGVGVDNIDVTYANKLGIEVRNTPNASSDSVAELAIAHMFSVARFLADSNFTMRMGSWNKKEYEGVELAGKTLGIIGMGRIGRSLAKKASAIGMNVVYYTIEGKYDDLTYKFESLEDLLSTSDFISLHVPYDKKTGYLIGKREFELMKEGVYLINCARGKVVDEEALVEALDNGKVAGAGIDVFEQEPTLNKKLINHKRVSVTPHVGASTKEAQDRIASEVVNIIIDFFDIK